MVNTTKRKKLFLLSDDIRSKSGVGVMSKAIAEGLADEYDIVQLGSMVKHPEQRPTQLTEHIKIYPNQGGYGNKGIVNRIMDVEKPDYMMIFTDPRSWIWLFRFEDEIRSKIPILYYHLWDNYPVPKYNKNYFNSVDWIGHINKLSGDIVKQLDDRFIKDEWRLKYIPHGINQNIYKPIDKNNEEFKNYINKYFNSTNAFDKYKFVIMWNNRNIKRKQAIDVIYGYKAFLDSLPKEKRKECLLILHTAAVDEYGTDLKACVKQMMPEYIWNVAFSIQKIDDDKLNYLYNFADVVVNLANNEGYGLSNAEAQMAGRMTITMLTGGLQDQANIVFENDSEIYNEETWLNDYKLKSHGEWTVPLLTTARTLNGSIPTPYIFEDRVDIREYVKALKYVHFLSKEERDKRGLKGREFMLNNGHSSTEMIKRFKESLIEIDKNWKPIDKFYFEKI